MKVLLLFLGAAFLLATTSCNKHTVVYRTKPTIYKTETYSTPSAPTSNKTKPGLPTKLSSGPSPASTSTAY